MSDAIRQLVDDLLVAWNDHDPKRAETFYAIDYEGIDVGMAQPQHSPGERASYERSSYCPSCQHRIGNHVLG